LGPTIERRKIFQRKCSKLVAEDKEGQEDEDEDEDEEGLQEVEGHRDV
jgi:hypothetical protein